MARKPKAAPSVTVLPVMEGTAYSAEAIAPVLTEWLASLGIPRIVSGLDVRNIVRGRRKGIASPVPRLLVRPPFGNRTHTYTLTEAADVFACFGRLAGQPDAKLPAPFAGHTTGSVPSRQSARKRTATGSAAARKARGETVQSQPHRSETAQPSAEADATA